MTDETDTPTSDDLQPIWKALADPTRRGVLKLLRGGPLPTTEIVNALPHLSRFGVMKHMAVLREAGLITVRRDGSRRLNSLNVVPIRRVYEDLVDDYQNLWASRLTDLKKDLEGRSPDDLDPQ